MKTWRAFLGPSRFGPFQAVVGWPEDGALPVTAEALDLLEGGFGGKLRVRPGSPRSVAANEVALALASLLLPEANRLRPKTTRAERAVGLGTWHHEGARTLIEVAVDLVREACEGGKLEIPLERLRFLSPDEDELPEQTLLRNTAEREGTFAHRLDLGDGSKLLVLGSGARQRRVLGLLPDATAFAGHLATNKNVACELLARAGVPVPEGKTVLSREQARVAARELGYPVTLKVATGSRQRGVVPCVVSESALERSLDLFGKKQVAQELRLERHVPGEYFRGFVAAGELVACATTPLPRARGDGKLTIRELIARQHSWLDDVLRKPALRENAERIVRHVLAGHDLALEDVLERGREVPIAFATSQGFSHDVTHKVHPDNKRLLVRAARVLGMFWSGIDVQAKRIDEPIEHHGGVVIEVNDIPAFAFHGTPLPGEGVGVDMGDAIFRAFWKDRSGDVPVLLVAGPMPTRQRVALKIARALWKKKVATTVDGGDAAGELACGLEPALDPECEAIVLMPTPEELFERGLGVPGIDVLVDLGDEAREYAAVGKVLGESCKRHRGTWIRNRDEKKAAEQGLARLLELLRA